MSRPKTIEEFNTKYNDFLKEFLPDFLNVCGETKNPAMTFDMSCKSNNVVSIELCIAAFNGMTMEEMTYEQDSQD